MADEYIHKQNAIDKINERQRKLIYCFGFENDAVKIMDIAKSIIIAIPAADVAPVVHGKWINEYWHSETVRRCSVCKITQTVNVYEGKVKFNYCPYCGAKMDGKREE